MSNQIFLDTNILVYSRDEASPFYSQVCEALKGLVGKGFALCIHRQVLREYACGNYSDPPSPLTSPPLEEEGLGEGD